MLRVNLNGLKKEDRVRLDNTTSGKPRKTNNGSDSEKSTVDGQVRWDNTTSGKPRKQNDRLA